MPSPTAAKRLSTADALAAMFADDVTAAGPGNVYVQGKARSLEALRANKDNLDSRAEWTPIRGGISADGLHGFTFGYMTVVKKDDTKIQLKYLAYWVKGTDGWRVAAYRRRPRPEGTLAVEMMPPALPERMVPPDTSPAHAATVRQQPLGCRTGLFGRGAEDRDRSRVCEVRQRRCRQHGRSQGRRRSSSAEAIGRSVGAGQPD